MSKEYIYWGLGLRVWGLGFRDQGLQIIATLGPNVYK